MITSHKNRLSLFAILSMVLTLGFPASTIFPTTAADTATTGSIVLNNVQTTSGTVSSSNQMTLSSFNVGTSSNSLLVVGISANNADAASVTYGGVPLTKAVSSFNNNYAAFWYLVNPSSTGDVVVTMNGPTSAVVGAYSYSGVDQTNPIPTVSKTSSTTAGSPSISITTANPNSLVLDLPSIYGDTSLGSPTCSQQWDVDIPSAITGASSSTSLSSPGSVTCSWTASGSGDLWDDVAIEVKASGSAGGTGGGGTGGPSTSCGTQTQIGSNFNGNSIAGENFIWFNSNMDLKSQVPSSGLAIYFTHQTITGTDFTASVPDSEVIFSPSATSASTSFNTSTNMWVTTVPASFAGDVFLSGLAFQVPTGGLPGGEDVTWHGTITSSAPFSMQWKWGAAVYTSFGDYNSIGVKPVHSTSLDSYPNGDQAGTPENEKSSVIGGARGGGGSNWTGSWSATVSASSNCTTPSSPPVVLTVNTQFQNGTALNGMYVELQDTSGNDMETGFSPVSFTVNSGQQYVVVVNNFACNNFAYWLDTGSTNNARNISITTNTTITAVYTVNCPTTSNLSVGTTECPCTPGDFGLILSQNGQEVASGNGTTTFKLNNGQSYTLTAQDSPGWTFAFWSDTGSTNRTRTISITSDTSITACYRIAS